MNQFEHESRFEIRASFSSRTGKTFLEDSYFTSPFKIMKPFEGEDGGITVFQQLSSAGILAGDRQVQKITVGKGARVKIVSQSFEKIFKMEEGEKAERAISAGIEDNAMLLFTPLPCIPFAESSFSSWAKFFLKDKSSCLVYEDILCAGRIAHGEAFDYRSYRNLVEVWREGRLIFRDNASFTGSDGGRNTGAKKLLQSQSLFGHFTHSGSLLLFGSGKNCASIREELELESKLLYTDDAKAKEADAGKVLAEASQTAFGDIVVRALGYSAEDIQKTFDRILSKTGFSLL